jgi:hypothetical protein
VVLESALSFHVGGKEHWLVTGRTD